MVTEIRELLYDNSPIFLQNIYIWAGKSLENRHSMKYLPEIDSELKRTETFSRLELEELQLERLKRLVYYAYENVPYYHELFDSVSLRPSDIRELRDISKIPLLDKQTVRLYGERMISRDVDQREIWHSHTSGTTGTPLSFVMDLRTQSYYQAHIVRHRQWFGYEYDEYCGSLGGKKIIPPRQKQGPFWRYDTPDKLVVFSTFHLDPDTMDDYVSFLTKKGIRYLKGYPSNLYILAQHILKRDTVVPMEVVFTGAEPVYDHMREAIEKAFKCRVADFYGQSEEVARAYECSEHEGYHVAMESTFVEILDEHGEPSGEGEIIGTSLTNYAMPFIRYRTGDLSGFIGGKCPCGREHVRIRQVQTKLEDIVVTASGRWLSPSNLTHPFKSLDPLAIERSQIIQDDIGSIVILVQPGPKWGAAAERNLLANFKERFGNELEVSVQEVPEITISGDSKFMWVKSEIR